MLSAPWPSRIHVAIGTTLASIAISAVSATGIADTAEIAMKLQLTDWYAIIYLKFEVLSAIMRLGSQQSLFSDSF